MDLEVALGKSLDQLATDKRKSNAGSGGRGRFFGTQRAMGRGMRLQGAYGRGNRGSFDGGRSASRFGRGRQDGNVSFHRGGRGTGFSLQRNHAIRRSFNGKFVRGAAHSPVDIRNTGVTRLRRSTNEERVQIRARDRRRHTVSQARFDTRDGGRGRGGRAGFTRRGGRGGSAQFVGGNSSWGKILGL